MNLSMLEKMIRDGDISRDTMRYLMNCHAECAWLDYKINFYLESEKQLCDFAKDVLAFKNVGGGFLVIGVEDKTWKPTGIRAEIPYDSKLLRDKIRKAAGVELEVHIVHHKFNIAGSTGIFALIYIRSSRKRNKRRVPTLVAKDFCANKPFGLRRGDIYVRRVDETVKISSADELEELLDDLEAQADQDALETSGSNSPFAIEDGTYKLLEKGFDSFIGRDKLKEEIISAVTQDPRIWIINVHGPGGAGKSALVNWAVYNLYEKRTFESIIQLTAKDSMLTPKGITRFGRSLYSIENLLDHILDTFQERQPDTLEEKKAVALEIMSAWSILLVLDNMETVQDGRIIEFIQQLPVESQAKVLMTSRTRTGTWELPVSVNELDVSEVGEFMQIRAQELEISIPHDRKLAKSVWEVSGGLPLAIQWILGRYRLGGDLRGALEDVSAKDSPVLEFSFRNIWAILSPDAKAILGAMTIFDEPPTTQQMAVATRFDMDTIEKSFTELADVTLVTKQIQSSDNRVRYVALPITMSFARNQLDGMGDFEIECRQRYQQYVEQMDLQESEMFRFRSEFDKYGLDTNNEKKAAILCQRGKSEMFAGNVDNADMLFKQARDLAPQSAYVYAMSASYDLARNRLGKALDHVKKACKLATKKTGALAYLIKARILDVQHDRYGRLEALEKSLEYDPDDMLTRHQYGVALSRAGRPDDAIDQFNIIIAHEKEKAPPTTQLLMALKTRMINLKRLGRMSELNSDLTWVDQMMSKYKHLTRDAKEFDQFRD